MLIILYLATISFCALYAPQPLLAVFSEQFNVAPEYTSLLITVTLIPLGIAPILYGYILESIPSKTLLKYSFTLLAITETGFIFINDFWVLLAIRSFQGLLFPAIFTALMTYISTTASKSHIKKQVTYYIAATILGGFLGRFIAGFTATYASWHWAFAILSIGLMIGVLLLFYLEQDIKLHLLHPTWRAISQTFQQPIFFRIYLIIFLTFFCFASLLNVLPFRLMGLNQQTSEIQIAFAYSGYLIGIISALNSVRVSEWLGESRVIIIGLIVYFTSLLIFLIPNEYSFFANMFMFCGGMFLVHGVLSSHLNHLAQSNKGLVNGLYIACYYAGGALGSYVPNYLYRFAGWEIYLLFLLSLVGIALGLAYNLLMLERTLKNHKINSF
ncbi:MFS transporter [Candidatus Albibeggiatoa sp. nov. NOAA]|uniref:MFS transporter n=1 Tax=Candidatus Albibeggiatoa sp. nov. NOAA TaxID=3162724 RepID=UPI0032FFDC44|nr:MFS transporter [Thiotrichaceae bacterium]